MYCAEIINTEAPMRSSNEGISYGFGAFIVQIKFFSPGVSQGTLICPNI
jgi:hypothetical protein